MSTRTIVACLLAIGCLGSGEPPTDETIARLRQQAKAVEEHVNTDAARELVRAVTVLEPVEPRTIHFRPGGGYLTEAYTAEQHAGLDEAVRAGLREMPVDTARYYETFYGSPVASVRAYDIAASHGLATFDGARVLDFGFGSVGQLRMLAACGAEVIGTEVMPLLAAIYAGETGRATVKGPEDREGAVTMVFGRWPASESVIDAVGRNFDLILSKNTIKRGYVRPTAEVAPEQRLDFGVTNDVFLSRLLGSLAPGGIVVFYNLGGRPPAEGEPYVPATDIASPWTKAEYEAKGFEVLAIDVDDTEMARTYGRALGWDAGENPMDLEGLFARYTVLRRPKADGGSEDD